ncbi:C-type lectin domain family 2 member D [Chelydra serpentina]|uniref:C-type lectin domain family 2 member D n=1 Tax=Chelydra serpentina TaxID=8475 RepID=A0A8T1RWH6_CHESE|nr:C-type lectin domain family 2 member D [Chelydra serpentina]
MGPGASASESKKPLMPLDDRRRLQKNKGDPEPPRNCRKCNYYKKCRIVLAVALAAVSSGLIAATVLAVLLFMRSSGGQATSAVPSQGPPFVPSWGAPFVPCCLEGWVGYGGKCYYFSKEAKNWDSSQHFCSLFNASLAVIDTQQEKDFMVRYAGLFGTGSASEENQASPGSG